MILRLKSLVTMECTSPGVVYELFVRKKPYVKREPMFHFDVLTPMNPRIVVYEGKNDVQYIELRLMLNRYKLLLCPLVNIEECTSPGVVYELFLSRKTLRLKSAKGDICPSMSHFDVLSFRIRGL